MGALAPKQLLVPLAARLNVVNRDQGLWSHRCLLALIMYDVKYSTHVQCRTASAGIITVGLASIKRPIDPAVDICYAPKVCSRSLMACSRADRTFAHVPLACPSAALRTNGSIVLSFSCVSFFRPVGRNTTHKALKIIDKRKP